MSDFGETLDEMDTEAFMNVRTWLEKALSDAGAEITHGGMGAGRADVGIHLEGMPYALSIRPEPLSRK
jgi:hypothetical protein